MEINFFVEFPKNFEHPNFFENPNFFGIPKFAQRKNIFDVHLFSDYYLLIDHTQFVTLLTGHRPTVSLEKFQNQLYYEKIQLQGSKTQIDISFHFAKREKI